MCCCCFLSVDLASDSMGYGSLKLFYIYTHTMYHKLELSLNFRFFMTRLHDVLFYHQKYDASIVRRTAVGKGICLSYMWVLSDHVPHPSLSITIDLVPQLTHFFMNKILSIFDIIKKCSNAFHLNIVALNNNKKRVLYQIAFSIIQRSHEIQHQHTEGTILSLCSWHKTIYP